MTEQKTCGHAWVIDDTQDYVYCGECLIAQDDASACIFTDCVSKDRHWHFGFPGGYDNPADPEGPPISFTTEPTPGVRDYNGALLTGADR